jgi:probable rRNA maturation factor
MAARLELRIDGGNWGVPAEVEGVAVRAVTAAMETAGLGDSAVEVSLFLTTDEAITALNAQFRGQPKPTNVLSWPAFALAPPAPGERPPLPRALPGEAMPIGDIALAFETVAAEANDQNLAFDDHATHLIIHGVLHLLGFDHERDEDAEVMEGIERVALARLGVADPYR